MIGAPHQVGQFLRRVRQRRPFGDRAINVSGAEHRPHVLPRERQAAGDDQHRHILCIGLGDAGECVLDAGPACAREHAVPLATLDAGIAVGEADADALLPAQDRADVERRARLDDRVARIAGEELRALALEDFGDDLRAVHARFSPIRLSRAGGCRAFFSMARNIGEVIPPRTEARKPESNQWARLSMPGGRRGHPNQRRRLAGGHDAHPSSPASPYKSDSFLPRDNGRRLVMASVHVLPAVQLGTFPSVRVSDFPDVAIKVVYFSLVATAFVFVSILLTGIHP